jgi:hypothetical protein
MKLSLAIFAAASPFSGFAELCSKPRKLRHRLPWHQEAPGEHHAQCDEHFSA